jgi:DNA-binding response OmpR family regulator
VSSPKKRILLVEKADGARTDLRKAIGSRCDLFAVTSGEDAIEACRTIGPFAVAVAEHGLPDVSAFELLRRVNESWPETVGLLIAPDGDTQVATRAVKEAHVFRCVSAPCDPGALLSAVDAALSRHEEMERLESFSEELLFGKDSMESFTELLEDKVEHQAAALRRLHRFTIELVGARSTREIAQMAAAAASEALGGRGVQIQLWQASVRGEDVHVGSGGEMSAFLHRTPIVAAAGEIGEICVDMFGSEGRKLSALDTSLLASFGASTSLAVHQELCRRRSRPRAARDDPGARAARRAPRHGHRTAPRARRELLPPRRGEPANAEARRRADHGRVHRGPRELEPAPRHRQGRDPGLDPPEAREALAGGVGDHEDARRDRRLDARRRHRRPRGARLPHDGAATSPGATTRSGTVPATRAACAARRSRSPPGSSRWPTSTTR